MKKQRSELVAKENIEDKLVNSLPKFPYGYNVRSLIVENKVRRKRKGRICDKLGRFGKPRNFVNKYDLL